MGNRIYGCDDCLAVCPWNKFAQTHAARRSSHARDDLARAAAGRAGARSTMRRSARCSPTAIKRIGRDRFVRNVLIAIGNSGDASLAREAERLLDDASPLVRGAAVWALSRLLPREKFAALAERRDEDDRSVNEEWTTAIF